MATRDQLLRAARRLWKIADNNRGALSVQEIQTVDAIRAALGDDFDRDVEASIAGIVAEAMDTRPKTVADALSAISAVASSS